MNVNDSIFEKSDPLDIKNRGGLEASTRGFDRSSRTKDSAGPEADTRNKQKPDLTVPQKGWQVVYDFSKVGGVVGLPKIKNMQHLI